MLENVLIGAHQYVPERCRAYNYPDRITELMSKTKVFLVPTSQIAKISREYKLEGKMMSDEVIFVPMDDFWFSPIGYYDSWEKVRQEVYEELYSKKYILWGTGVSGICGGGVLGEALKNLKLNNLEVDRHSLWTIQDYRGHGQQSNRIVYKPGISGIFA